MAGEAVERIADLFQLLKHPSIGRLRRGLSRAELREVVARSPNFDTEWIDDTVETWWSWHNGVEPVHPNYQPGLSPCHGLTLTSFGGAVTNFTGLLTEFEGTVDEAEMVKTLHTAMFEVPVIPLTAQQSVLCLRKTSSEPDLPWTMWTFSMEGHWTPVLAPGESDPPTFESYLQSLARRLAIGDLEMTSSLRIMRKGQTSGNIPYPWA